MSNGRSRCRAIAVGAALSAAAALMAMPAVAQTLKDLTPEQRERIPPERLREMPYLDAMELLVDDFSRADAILNIQVLLHDLWFYSGPPDGETSTGLTDAIRGFQRSIESVPTGVLLAGEFDELARRVNYTRYTPIYLPEPRRVATTEDLALLSGTWARRDGPGGYPIQTSRVECHRDPQTCMEVTALLSEWDDSDGANLALVTTFWNVTKWTAQEIVAEKDSPGCVAATLTVHIGEQTAHQRQEPRSGAECEGVPVRAQTLELVDGSQVASAYWDRRHRLAHEHMNPELRERLRGLGPTAPSR